jgi:hypothetical protein
MVAATDRAPRSTVPTPPAPAASSAAEDRTRVWYRDGERPQLVLPGDRRETIRSVLKIDYPMRFGGYVWDDRDIPQGPVWVRVDIAKQLISVFRGGHEIGSAVVLYGAESKPTPAGAFTVLQKAEDYHSRTYDAPMPFMLRLTADGVAIHASNVREGWATHGCIGVPDEFARHLFAEMQLGDPVFIVT